MLSVVVLLSSVAATLAVKCCAPPQFEGRIGFITAVIHNGKVQTSSVRKIKIKFWFYRTNTNLSIIFQNTFPKYHQIAEEFGSVSLYQAWSFGQILPESNTQKKNKHFVKNVKKVRSFKQHFCLQWENTRVGAFLVANNLCDYFKVCNSFEFPSYA